MLTLLVLLFTVGLLLYAKLRWHYSYWSRRGVAGEKPVYFRGNMSGLGRDLHWTDINLRIYRKFRGVERYCGYFTFMTKSLFIMDLELIRDIMIRDFSSFADRGLFHNVRDDPLTGNLLFLDGPDLYPQPELFDPSRFEADKSSSRHPFAYLPFGDGPRNCIGLRFGKMQAKIGIVSLLQRFKFGVSDQTEIPLVLDTRSPTLAVKHGIHLKVERI